MLKLSKVKALLERQDILPPSITSPASPWLQGALDIQFTKHESDKRHAIERRNQHARELFGAIQKTKDEKMEKEKKVA